MDEISMTDRMAPAPLLAPPVTLARGGGIALWRQIAARMEADIRAGHRPPGDRLPTEAMLSAVFSVNRHTVRRAMEALESRGLVRIEQGRGSFVTEDVLDYPLGARTRFSETIRRQNREPAGVLRQIQEIPAEAAIAEALRIRTGRPVLRVERLALADNRPVLIGTHHFPLPRFAAAAALLAHDASITAAMAGCGVADYRRLSTRISARLPTAEEAEALRMARAQPVILTEAINVDLDGVPVDVTHSRYAAHRVQLVVES